VLDISAGSVRFEIDAELEGLGPVAGQGVLHGLASGRRQKIPDAVMAPDFIFQQIADLEIKGVFSVEMQDGVGHGLKQAPVCSDAICFGFSAASGGAESW
jgi:hypothetical protein